MNPGKLAETCLEGMAQMRYQDRQLNRTPPTR